MAALVLACSGAAAGAQVVAVPAAHLHHVEGSVAHAPQGDKEWQDVQPRRLLKRGDRLWTDGGSRAELQAAGHQLRLDARTQLVLENVGQSATQLSLTQGSLAITVTGLNDGESFEVGTPNLAFRARQAGDYRIDVDVKEGITRVVVMSGAGVVYGEQGEAMEVRNGQRLSFRDRGLTRVQQPAFAATDDFDRWAGARRRGEPTVSMPRLAAPATPATPTALDNRRTIIIPGGPAVATAPAAAALKVNVPGDRPANALDPAVVAPAAPAPRSTPAPAAQPALQAQADVQAQAKALAAQQAQAAAEARARAAAEAQARAEHERAAAADRTARAQQLRRAEAMEARREQERRAVAARRAEQQQQQQQRAVAARRAEEERKQANARREAEQKRVAAARRAEDERRQAQARRAAEEKRLAAVRQAETQKLAEQARRQQLARLQEQAQREEQAARARREQAAREAEEDRRDDDVRRQRALADQWQRDQDRREQEVWLRQRQYQLQPLRPAPMGVPARRVS